MRIEKQDQMELSEAIILKDEFFRQIGYENNITRRFPHPQLRAAFSVATAEYIESLQPYTISLALGINHSTVNYYMRRHPYWMTSNHRSDQIYTQFYERAVQFAKFNNINGEHVQRIHCRSLIGFI